MTANYRSAWKDDEIQALSEVAAKFIDSEVTAHRETWERQRQVDRSVWRKAGDLGLLCCSIPQEYGGAGGTIAHDLAVCEAQGAAGDWDWGYMVHSGIVAHYLLAYGTEEQKQTWLPAMARGEVVGAIAMTEPGAGSDLQAVRTKAMAEGDSLIIDGAKTFISNGQTADLIVVVAKTDPSAGGRGLSLVLVDTRDAAGFTRGKPLDKIGQHGADTSELFFQGVRVPATNILGGTPGQGFAQLMTHLARERLFIGVMAVGSMETALRDTVAYTKQRQAFGQSIFSFQNSRFVLAEVATTAHVARVFVDACIERLLVGQLDVTTAAMAKWWLTEQQTQVIDRCLQLYGGYGYIREYSIARLYQDARAQKIYGGANEIMKELIARTL